MSFTWSVSYETATIARGECATKAEADRAAHVEHDRLVLSGLNPDALAYHVREDCSSRLERIALTLEAAREVASESPRTKLSDQLVASVCKNASRELEELAREFVRS